MSKKTKKKISNGKENICWQAYTRWMGSPDSWTHMHYAVLSAIFIYFGQDCPLETGKDTFISLSNW